MHQQPASKSRLTARQGIIHAALLLPLVAITLRLRLGGESLIGDDAYMTFRVVRNLIEGRGFVCNPGEYVISTTTPLFALLLAGVSVITSLPPHEAFRYLCFPFSALNIVLLYFIAYRFSHSKTAAFIAASLFALSNYSAYADALGMETPLFISFILGAVLASAGPSNRGRSIVAALLAAFAFITRPEGVLLLPAILAYAAWCRRRLPWPELLTIGAILTAWFAFLYIYFGTIVPQSVHAKSFGYYRQPFAAIGSMLLHLLSLVFHPLIAFPYLRAVALGVIAAMFVLGVLRAASVNSAAWILLFFTVGIIGGYAFTNPFIFLWYVVPLEPGYCVFIALGVFALFEDIKSKLGTPAYVLGVAFFAVWLVAAVGRYDRLTLLTTIHGRSVELPADATISERIRWSLYMPQISTIERERLYKHFALSLRPITDSRTTVLAPEFGAFAYFNDAKMISSIGHVNPEVMQYLPVSVEEVDPIANNAVSREMLRGIRPDYVLSLDIFIRRSLLNDPWFHEHYEPVYTVSSRAFRADKLYLFARKEIADRHRAFFESLQRAGRRSGTMEAF